VAYQSFTIAVANLDDAPVITSVAPEGAVQGYLWTYAPRALDPDVEAGGAGDPLALSWVQTAGPPTLLADWRAPVTTVTPASWGELRFALVAFDGELQSLPAEITLRVASPNNRPPEADAGPDAEGAPGVPVALDGSGSHDPEGAALTWTWTQVDGPNVNLADAAGPTPTFVPGLEGSYRFRLVVADLLFESAPDDVQVEVREPVPEPVVDEVEPLPDAQRADPAEPDMHLPLDANPIEAVEAAEAAEGSGGGNGCTVGDDGRSPRTLALLGLVLLTVTLRRRRPVA
jgi:MYXO-CTERM domain-containing protein